MISTPTNTSKGGTIVYTENSWMSLKDKISIYVTICMNQSGFKSKIKILKTLCGNIYRHPNDNNLIYNNFLNYLELCLSILSNENKDVYICGDFNSDLLKLDNFEDVMNNLRIFTSD